MKKIILLFAFFFLPVTFNFLLTTCDSTEPPPENPPGYQEDIPWPSLADSPWPMSNHDPQNTGRSNFLGPQSGIVSGEISAHNLGTNIAVGKDSLLYFLTSNPTSLVCSGFNGNIKWEKLISNSSSCSPLISNEGNIYVGGIYQLFAFNSLGDTLWTLKLDQILSRSLNVDLDGTLYIIDATQTLFAINKLGIILWTLKDNRIAKRLLHQPAISPDGKTIYVQGEAVSLLAIDIENKSVKWTFGNAILPSGPMVDNQGNVYVLPGPRMDQTFTKKYFYSLTPEGQIRWKIKLYDQYLKFFDIPTIDRTGNVYFGSDSLYSVSFEGKINWKVSRENFDVRTSITCDRNNQIYFGTSFNSLISFNNKGELVWELELQKTNRAPISAVIATDNLIFLPIFESECIYKIN